MNTLFFAEIRKFPFSKPCQGVRNYESINSETLMENLMANRQKTALCLTPQAMYNQFKRPSAGSVIELYHIYRNT